jgi:hypothetical protein
LAARHPDRGSRPFLPFAGPKGRYRRLASCWERSCARPLAGRSSSKP